jgi:hypothetical protein
MNMTRDNRVLVLSLFLSFLFAIGTAPAAFSQAGDTQVAVSRGYRTGYSDGYMAGYRDSIDGVTKNYSRHSEYVKAERAFSREYGNKEDYRDGYQQGFEVGYDTGFERRSFESALPADLKLRGYVKTVAAAEQPSAEEKVVNSSDPLPSQNTASEAARVSDKTEATVASIPTDARVIIPRDTEIILAMGEDLSTDLTREGERFTAKVVSPGEIAGAIIEGRVTKVRKPGRIKRHSELLLSFDRIVLPDQRWSNFSGTLVEVFAIKGDNIRRVDIEGTAIGRSTLKKDAMKVGAATGGGLITGGIIGGPVGAAVGAGVGAAFGVGAVVIERGNHIRLNKDQQVRIRTEYETQIR